ncbi:MAG: riboflavin synthase [Acidobacteria bacterium]|nr:MAG: riboflavin synthase [Acidobacteriota bacterium]
MGFGTSVVLSALGVNCGKLEFEVIEAIMFTGIIEHQGKIEALQLTRDGGRVTIHAPSVAPSLVVSNSIAVNGCCLTVVDLHNSRLSADLSGETISKTSFGAKGGELCVGMRVNLEQPLTAGKEFGGHFVLGHVDTVGRVTHLTPEGENWWYGVRVPEEFARYIVPKGSLAIDGISLTVARWQNNIAEVAIIPYTYEHSNIRDRKSGDAVNLEGDVLGKYVERYLEERKASVAGGELTIERLVQQGF